MKEKLFYKMMEVRYMLTTEKMKNQTKYYVRWDYKDSGYPFSKVVEISKEEYEQLEKEF